MGSSGPIIVIEDDIDDRELLTEVFKELEYPNELIFFHNGYEALEFLNKADVLPFLILSDINMPRINGFELRNEVKNNANLHLKCIPYLFFTTASSRQMVIDAYSASVQGFFIKQDSYQELKDLIETIMKYWLKCSSPNNFED